MSCIAFDVGWPTSLRASMTVPRQRSTPEPFGRLPEGMSPYAADSKKSLAFSSATPEKILSASPVASPPRRPGAALLTAFFESPSHFFISPWRSKKSMPPPAPPPPATRIDLSISHADPVRSGLRLKDPSERLPRSTCAWL